MRSFIPIVAFASFLWAFAVAPLQHTHERQGVEHAHGFDHKHGDHRTADGVEWEADDHDSDARFDDWIPGDGKISSAVYVVQTALLVTPVPAVQPGRIVERRPQNHDPPQQLHIPPRAPPG